MKLKRKVGKYSKISIILGIILIAIILFLLLRPKGITFEKGFYKLLSYDDKYNTSFKFERLNRTMVDNNKIDPFIKDLEKFRKKILKYENTTNTQALIILTDARINMLKSEKYFYLAKDIGDIGIAEDGFRCSEKPYLINSAYYYNNSYKYGIQAYSQIDDLLNIYKNVTKLRDLVGINEARIKFYASPLFELQGIADVNIKALIKSCDYDRSKPLLPVIIR